MQTDTPLHSDVPPPSSSPPPIQVQISKLNSVLSSMEGNRHKCPPHEVTFHQPSFKTPPEEYELTSSDSDPSSTTEAVKERHCHLLPPIPPSFTSQTSHLSTFHTGTPARTAVAEPWEQQKQEYSWREGIGVHPPLSKIGQQASTNSVMETLVSINTQVAELMNQVRTSGAAKVGGLCDGGHSVTLPHQHCRVPSMTEPLGGALPLTNTSVRYCTRL